LLKLRWGGGKHGREGTRGRVSGMGGFEGVDFLLLGRNQLLEVGDLLLEVGVAVGNFLLLLLDRFDDRGEKLAIRVPPRLMQKCTISRNSRCAIARPAAYVCVL
jgi:hypothetical protein